MWVFAVSLSALCLLADAQGWCGGYSWMTEGEFESPNYPDSYGKLEDCEYVIDPEEGMLELAIDFDVEEGSYYCEYDYIEVYDEDGNLLDKLCKYGTRFFYGTYFKIKFHSDFSVVKGGFYIQWRQACGGNHWESSGNIATPGYPQSYENDLSCEWYISPWDNPIELNITYEIEYGDDDCPYDKIQVYNSYYRLIDTLCGSGNATYYGWSFVLVFITDSSFNGEGFEASWAQLFKCACRALYRYASVNSCTMWVFAVSLSALLVLADAQSWCGGYSWSPEGEYESPNFPEPYGKLEDCEYVIDPEEGMLELVIGYDVEEGSYYCEYDYLEVYDEDGNLLDKLCKYGIRFFYGTYFKIKFHSDFSVVRDGFKIYWRKACGEEYRDNNGYISTPGYPLEYYENDLSCEWYISSLDSPVELNISYNIEYGDSDCPYDNIQVYNSEWQLIDSLCGHGNATYYGLAFVLTFISDYSVNGEGFEASWAPYSGDYKTEPTFTPTWTWAWLSNTSSSSSSPSSMSSSSTSSSTSSSPSTVGLY
ncbi:hypothetical protein ScPMuIL_008952 [Solemya velum]